MELYLDTVKSGEQILIVDDLIATGSTCEAGIKLIRKMQRNIIGCAFVLDLSELSRRKRIEALGVSVHTLCKFDRH